MSKFMIILSFALILQFMFSPLIMYLFQLFIFCVFYFLFFSIPFTFQVRLLLSLKMPIFTIHSSPYLLIFVPQWILYFIDLTFYFFPSFYPQHSFIWCLFWFLFLSSHPDILIQQIVWLLYILSFFNLLILLLQYSLNNNQNKRGMEYFGLDDNKKIGMFLLAVSALCYTFGILFLFRRSFILMANLLFLLGLYFFIGITGIIKFFTKKGKLQGSFVYFGGLVVIFLGFTIIGVFGQIVGFFIIFRSFLPDFYDYICRLPVVGHYLKSYRVQNALDKLAGNNRI